MDALSIFKTYLKANSSLAIKEVETISSFFNVNHIEKENILFKEGLIFRKLIFVADGILRVFVNSEKDEELTKHFIEPNSFFMDFGSFENCFPTTINVSCVTEATILSLSKSDSDKLIHEMPQWANYLKIGAMQTMNDLIRKQTFLRIGDSTEKYRYFVENFPNLAQNVPLKYIASYLNITQSSLSRIRKNI